MKIMLYTNKMVSGGAERVIANLANYLSQENEVILMTYIKGKSFYELDKKIKFYSCLNKEITKKRFDNIIALKNIYSIVKSESPDIILSFLETPNLHMLLLKKILKVPLIISVRNDPSQIFNTRLKKLTLKYLYKRADGLVLQTKEAKEYFNETIQKKSVIIPNPVNPKFLKEPYCGQREKKIVSVGRLVNQKQQDVLIDAFEIVNKEYNDYKLVIYGEGELRNKLQEKINDIGLNEKISLPGNVANIENEIYKYSMFVLSSKYEGMPNSLMEAMALGIPSISTDCPCGGPKFLIDNNKNGILVKVNDKKEMAKAMKKIIQDSKFANFIAKNASERLKELEPGKINKIWQNFILEIYSKNNRR